MPEKSKVIVLIGPMGVGKTTIGRKLARALNVDFVDTDALIIAEYGKIEDIFENSGEETFRAYELNALKRAVSNPGVVATGGGAVISPEAQKVLADSTVIYLATDGRHIGSRLRHGNRPLIQNGIEDWRRIYNERKSTYSALADIEVDTSTQPLAATIAEIRERLSI